jgi:hypothetical protein
MKRGQFYPGRAKLTAGFLATQCPAGEVGPEIMKQGRYP